MVRYVFEHGGLWLGGKFWLFGSGLSFIDGALDVDIGLEVLAYLRRRLITDALSGHSERAGKTQQAVDVEGDTGGHCSGCFGMETDLTREPLRSLGGDSTECGLPLTGTRAW